MTLLIQNGRAPVIEADSVEYLPGGGLRIELPDGSTTLASPQGWLTITITPKASLAREEDTE